MAKFEIEDVIGERSPGRLIRRINKLFDKRVRQNFPGSEQSFEEWMAIKLIFDGIAENAGDLSRHFGIATGATTRLIDSLEEKGFLERDRTGDDRRVVLLKLRPLGEAHFRSKLPEMIDCWNELFRDFSKDEVDQMITLLTKLKNAF